MAPTPPSVDVPASGSEDRIRRNVACISCRNSKVRCKANPVPGQPCQRCAKLLISCVVDKSHKRVTKRSKLEQLEEELKNIKQAVHPVAPGDTAWSPSSPRVNSSSAPERQPRHIPPQIPTPLPDPPAPSSRAPDRPVRTTPTESRQLGSHLVVGPDIDWYFNRFLQCYHPLLPVLRKKDPDECYDASPTLFWVIVYIASRRAPRNEDFWTALTEHVDREVWAGISAPTMSLEAIHATLFFCAWPLPKIRFVTDPSTVLAGIALNACLLLGLHTGSGSHSQFSYGTRSEFKSTDEEASSTWLACCFMAQRAASICGMPPPSIQHNDIPCKKALESPAWADLISMFNLQKFLNRLHTSMNAQTSVDETVPYAVVCNWEGEFDAVTPLLVQQDTDLTRFLVLSAQLEIQSYYFCGSTNAPNLDPRLITTKTLHTARALLTTAADLETRSGLLTHAPHWAARTVMDAACATLSILHSSAAPPDLAADDATALAHRACAAVQRCSVGDADLPYRGGIILETFWSVRHLLPRVDGAPGAWARRPGSGLTHWCLLTFREGLQAAQGRSEVATRGLEELRRQAARPQDIAIASSTAPEEQQQQPSAAVGTDPFLDVDWSMFMDDFGWAGGGDGVFMGLPT